MFSLLFVNKMKRADVTTKGKVRPLYFLPCTLPSNLTDWVSSIKNQGHNFFQISKIGITLTGIKKKKKDLIEKKNYVAVTN